jgi:hypothetical protein
MPLPAGKIQLFSDGILMGSTYLPYTSRDKDIAITMGKMPDIWGQKIKVNEVKLTKSSFKDTYKIIISNYKLKPATVMIKDVVFGNNWRIANSSLNYNKKSANEIVYSLTVPANTSQEINYDVIRDAQ